jgi:SAM-dependent methyltransferase
MARARIATAGLERRIHVTAGDFHRLTDVYGREQFDVVYFLESLSHSSRPGEALASVHEVLKPGGAVYIKDYFIRRCDDEEEQKRVLEVVARVDRLFATKTAWAADIREELRRAGFFPLWVARPQFPVDNRRWQRFESRHAFDLFAGAPSFDWSEWWEMRYTRW